ncbi:MAG: hypothetical protein ACK50I_14090 [Burkholderiales bacterium]|nr:hypothetical protein [Burkholderiales bacterium]MCZ8320911.1 hypothetical protein [Novosphingobium sp.]
MYFALFIPVTSVLLAVHSELLSKGSGFRGQGHEGLAELMVFFCERAVGFSSDVGLQDGGYFDALVRMFAQALRAIDALPAEHRPRLLRRLDAVRRLAHNLGYGVGDDMDDLLAEHRFDGGSR